MTVRNAAGRCLCDCFYMRSFCQHVAAWLIDRGIMLPPPQFTPTPSMGDRPVGDGRPGKRKGMDYLKSDGADKGKRRKSAAKGKGLASLQKSTELVRQDQILRSASGMAFTMRGATLGSSSVRRIRGRRRSNHYGGMAGRMRSKVSGTGIRRRAAVKPQRQGTSASQETGHGAGGAVTDTGGRVFGVYPDTPNPGDGVYIDQAIPIGSGVLPLTSAEEQSEKRLKKYSEFQQKCIEIQAARHAQMDRESAASRVVARTRQAKARGSDPSQTSWLPDWMDMQVDMVRDGIIEKQWTAAQIAEQCRGTVVQSSGEAGCGLFAGDVDIHAGDLVAVLSWGKVMSKRAPNMQAVRGGYQRYSTDPEGPTQWRGGCANEPSSGHDRNCVIVEVPAQRGLRGVMTVLVAVCTIPAGTEVLVHYGPTRDGEDTWAHRAGTGL